MARVVHLDIQRIGRAYIADCPAKTLAKTQGSRSVLGESMGKYAICLAVATGLLASACHSTDSVQFATLPNQAAMIRDGVPALSSRKAHSIVLVSPAQRGIQTGSRPVFVVAATNLTPQPFDLHVSDITVTQQTSDGVITPLPVITYEELTAEERNREIAVALLTGVAVAANSYSASQAGYQHVNGTVYTPGGPAAFHANFYDPSAAAIAQGNAAVMNDAMIANTMEAGQRNMAVLEHDVLKDNTVLPGQWVGGQVHITPPISETNKPKTYTIVVNVGGDTHSIAVTQGATTQ